MMVVNSFDLWQNDVFFSAAEEVQESADIMESAYRLWIKEKRESRVSIESNELCKELQAALTTAKWQLEEFERAVRLSHGNCRDDTTLTRHKQFVTAIENQIYRVESVLQEENGKQHMHWMDLNKEECDDLAMFLSRSSQTSGSEIINLTENPSEMNIRKETRDYSDSPDCVIDIEDRGSPESSNRKQTDRNSGTRRTWSSPNVPNISTLRINLPLDTKSGSQIEETPKEKGSKPLFWLQRCRDYNQFFDRNQRWFRFSLTRPIKLIISLTLILFLLMSFRVYSS